MKIQLVPKVWQISALQMTQTLISIEVSKNENYILQPCFLMKRFYSRKSFITVQLISIFFVEGKRASFRHQLHSTKKIERINQRILLTNLINIDRYRRSQYYRSTSLHKYVLKLFSATFLEQKKLWFETKLALVLQYLSNDTPCFKICQEMGLSSDSGCQEGTGLAPLREYLITIGILKVLGNHESLIRVSM